jgi:choline dehydrogenase
LHSIETEYDYIIVGSGSAGSIVANRLSADKNVSVLVLEAGGPDTNFWLKLPVGYFRTIYDERFSRIFKTEPSEGDGHRGIDWPRGKVVGGSSSINGLIYIRGQQEDFNDWSDLGANGWAFKDVLPHFKTLENCKTGVPEYRGRLGEMSVSNLRNDHPYCQAWMDAAEQFGLPKNPDFNGESNYGVGAYQLTLAGRWRASAARCFLHPAIF